MGTWVGQGTLIGLKQAIVENTLSGNTKGGLYESFIADANVGTGDDGVVTIPHYMALFI